MKNNHHIPPKWAHLFLKWYCKPELLEDLQGDLHEYFQRNVKAKGIRRAKFIYCIDVIKFLRLYTVRKPEFINLLINWIMIGSYIKTSGRSIVRHKLFSAINIIGLAVSMSVGLLMIGLLSDMFEYDKFHKNYDRTYRIISKYKYLDQEDNSYYASTSLRAAKSIQESIPGIEEMAVLLRGLEGDFRSDEKAVPLSGLWANESFFKVFTFTLISGDPVTALKNPYSIVLTEKTANKLFGHSDVMGKPVHFPKDRGGQEFIVTGILQDIPVFSHVKFDMLVALSTREITEKDNKSEMAWNNIWNAYVYLVLPERTDLENLQTNLNTITTREDKTVKNTSIKLALQPMSEIALGDDLNNSIGPVMGKGNVWMVGILSIIVILSACFNYANLSIARSLRRSREVGIRKVVGARSGHVLSQFVVEAVMIALLALVLSFAIFLLLKPYFLSINEYYSKMLVLNLPPTLILYFILLALVVGMAAGFFPALFFAQVNVLQVLKNTIIVRGVRNITLRKGLVVAQFTVSLMFIAATIIGYKHYKEVVAFDLGFNTENILNIRLDGNKADLLLKELSEIPEVKDLSSSAMVTSVGNYWGSLMKYTNPLDSQSVHYNAIDEHYLPLHKHKFLAGKNFSAQIENAEESEVIVNEKVLKRFNIADQDPEKAIGEIVTVNRKKLKIVAVIKDFHYGRSTDSEIKEFIFRCSPAKVNYINAKVISTDWPTTLGKIETAWKKIDNVHVMQASFYNEQIERAFNDFSSRIKIIGSLAFLAICIACIGLLGMVVFTTETRLKEISIRKVMGASEIKLVYLLSKGFLFLLATSAVIAIPATHFFFTKYALDEYADNAPIAIHELFVGIIGVMAIAFVMIGLQTLKVARSNPAEILKSE